MIGFPTGDTCLRVFGNLEQQIDAAEQQVNFRLAQSQLPLLGQGKTILHGMGDAHGGLEIHNAGRPFKGVSRAHEDLQLPGRSLAALEFEQTAGQNGGLVFSFHAEEFQHRTDCPGPRGCACSRQAPVEGRKEKIGIEQADGPALPVENALGVTQPGFRQGGRRLLQFRRLKPKDAADLIRREDEAMAVPLCHQQPVVGRARRFAERAPVQPQQVAEGDTDQQFAANIDEAQHNALPPMRQRMNRPALGHFLKRRRGQREPFSVDAEEQGGMPGWAGELLFLREMLGPRAAVFRQQRTVKQLNAGFGINRTVAAMDDLLQLRASGIALHADFVPASPNFHRLAVRQGPRPFVRHGGFVEL